MVEEIKAKARELLKNKQVGLIIGYRRAADGVLAAPAFIDKEQDAEALIWDANCVYNLVNYIKEFSGKRIGIVVKPCDLKAIVVLLQENQLKREDLFIIAVECSGVIDDKKIQSDVHPDEKIDLDEKCLKCEPAMPRIHDILISQKSKKAQGHRVDKDPYDNVRKFEVKSLQERFSFWKDEFSRCIRCYACRQICPMCYCPRCLADQAAPRWFTKACSFEGNFSWNLMRAMHLAGRCIDCGECERACPVGIPLRDINNKVEKDVRELFGYEAGADIEKKPLFSSFDKNDPEEFIR